MTDELSLLDETVEIPPEADLAQATLSVPASGGVCLFADPDNHPILLIHGANLRAIVRNRLAAPEPDEMTRRTQLRPITARLRIRRTYSPFETQLAYFHIATALYPDRLKEFLPHLDLHLIAIDPTNEYPHFDITDRFDNERSLYWGPFGTRKSATEYLQILQDIFDLCRRNDLLAQAPNAPRCSYGQMGRCTCLCDGTITAGEYRDIINTAIDMLNDPRTAQAQWQQQMQDFAAQLKFEQAQPLKLRLAQTAKLLGPAYRWVAPLTEFAVLTFQPGPRQKTEPKRPAEPTVSPFLIGPGWVSQIETFPLRQALPACQALIDHLQLTRFQAANTTPGPQQCHIFAWATRFLYGVTREKGLYLPAGALPDPQQLAETVTQHFSAPPKLKKKKPDLDTASLAANADQDLTDSSQ